VHRRSILHLLLIPRRDALRLLKATFNVVEADERVPSMPEDLTGWEKPSKPLVRASRAGRPGHIEDPGLNLLTTPASNRFIPPLLREGVAAERNGTAWANLRPRKVHPVVRSWGYVHH
jgi:hypothetical protein